MTVTYTTAAKVSSVLRLMDASNETRLVLSASTDPTSTEVETIIERKEDLIDRETHHAWRAVTADTEVIDIPGNCYNFHQRQFAIPLKHRKINTLVSETDKIELWDGSAWVDLVLTANGYTEGRGDDYWLDYELGILYLTGKRPYILDKGVKVTYRYGEASVPGDIEEACTKLAAIDLLETNDYVIVLPEGVGQYAIASKVDSWKKDINRILYNRREIITI